MSYDLKKRIWRETELDDLELLTEFYEFLQGTKLPDEIYISKKAQPKLSQEQAMTVIWFLQQHLNVLPDHIEQCSQCGDLYDTWQSGLYWESKGKHYCGGCDHLVPYNYDRGVGIKKKKRSK